MDARVASASRREWTADELRAEVARLGPWFHAIDLGRGVRTKTTSDFGEPADHPAGAWQTIARCLPADLTGLSVLDVGCNAGFYAVEAKRRGADRVLGVDAARHHVQQLQFVRSALGLEIEARRLSVYQLDPDEIGRFDITLALGLIYHCRHPMLALERLFAVTRTTLVLESAILPEGRLPASFSTPLGRREAILHSMAFVENPPGSSEAAHNWFLPSPESLEAMLRAAGFPDGQRVAVAGGRVVLVGHKPDQPGAHLSARLELLTAPSRVVSESALVVRVRVENRGALVWPALGGLSGGGGPVHLGAHLLARDHEETVVDWDWGRADLPGDVPPGGSATIEIQLRAPMQPGEYLLELDMVAEHLAWFEDIGSHPARHAFDVTGP